MTSIIFHGKKAVSPVFSNCYTIELEETGRRGIHMKIRSVELLESYFNGFDLEEKNVILTLALINFYEKEGYNNTEIEELFIQAKSDFFNYKDKNS